MREQLLLGLIAGSGDFVLPLWWHSWVQNPSPRVQWVLQAVLGVLGPPAVCPEGRGRLRTHWHLQGNLNPVSTRAGLMFSWPTRHLWLVLQPRHRSKAAAGVLGGRNGGYVHEREIQSK